METGRHMSCNETRAQLSHTEFGALCSKRARHRTDEYKSISRFLLKSVTRNRFTKPKSENLNSALIIQMFSFISPHSAT